MRIEFYAIALVLVSSAVFAAENTTKQGIGSSLTVSGLQYLPNPAIPGQYVDVWINVGNAKFDVTGVECKIEPQYPFSLDSNEEASKQIGSLGPGQNFVLKYKIR